MRRPTLRGVGRFVAAVAFAMLGCATANRSVVAWPAPPAKERIRLVRTYSSASDLEGSFARAWRKLAGLDAPVALYHPVGVAVTAKGDLLAVSDQALGSLFLFDFAAGELHMVPREALGGAPLGVALAGEAVWVVVPDRKAALSFDRAGRPLASIELTDCERPTGIAIDAEAGLAYVTDTSSTAGEGHAVHVHALAGGAHKAKFGQKGDGKGELFFPTFVAVSADGVFVADTMNARVVEFDKEGKFVRQFGERGDRFGQFDKPKGLATDSFGNLYVVDSFFSAVQIFNRDAKLLLFFAGPGDSPGFLANPAGIAIDGQNRIYVANGLNFRIDVYQLVNTSAADSLAQGVAAASN
jgi:DNA-binding beta-propeller fold protein YncE